MILQKKPTKKYNMSWKYIEHIGIIAFKYRISDIILFKFNLKF